MGITPWREQAIDPELAEGIGGALGVSPLTARALIRRGVHSVQEAERFLHPASMPAPDARLLPDAEAAVARIRQALDRHERIAVYGDYDADGVCATAVLLTVLKRLGGDAVYMLPSRHEDGYGLKRKAVDRMKLLGAKLIITVDNGISAGEEVAYALSLGLDVVITDHHVAGEQLPTGVPVVCPTRKDSQYPESTLCGAGVAYRLMRLLDPEGDYQQILAIAAVATVADVVPLTGENRAIVARGLPLVKEVMGFRALLEAAGLSQRPVNEGTAAYAITPRLNACGRVGRPDEALELLMSRDEAECARIAQELEDCNCRRRAMEQAVSAEAEPQAASQLCHRALFAWGQDWNPGVIGIVASRLTEKWSRAAFVFTGEGDELTGSARSVPGVHLVDCIGHGAEYVLRYGGHARAAGVTLKRDQLPAFQDAVNGFLRQTYGPELFEKQIVYEESVPLDAVSVSMAEELRRLAPFGEENPEPVLLFSGVAFTNIRIIGRDKRHLSATMTQNGESIRCVFFGAAGMAGILDSGKWEAAGVLSVNAFSGSPAAELTIKAVLRPQTQAQKEMSAFLEQCLYNSQCACDKIRVLCPPGIDMKPERMRVHYRAFKALLLEGARQADELAALLDAEQALALLVFTELGFFTVDASSRAVTLSQDAPSRKLDQSGLYRLMTAPRD